MSIQTTKHLTVADFDALPDSRHPIELIAGELIKMPPPSPAHQRNVIKLILLLDRLRPDGQVFTAPVPVYLDDENVVEPDVLWLTPDSKCIVTPKRLEGAPDLVIEVLSPSTARYDKTVKDLLYEKYGVREYWLLNLKRQSLEVWQRGESEFAVLGTFSASDSFESHVLEKTVNLSEIFA